MNAPDAPSGKNDFALVRRPPSAIEKSQPGANRILSDMIADTLALVKTSPLTRILIVDDEDWFLEMVKSAITTKFTNVTLQMFQDSKKAWQELLQADPDLLITDDKMDRGEELNGEDLVRRLVDRKATFPIIVVSGWPPTELWVREYTDNNPKITFLKKPFTAEQLYRELSKYLGASEDSQPQFRNSET